MFLCVCISLHLFGVLLFQLARRRHAPNSKMYGFAADEGKHADALDRDSA